MVTLNDTAAIREIFHGCKIKGVSRPRGIADGGAVYKELVIVPA